jgi:hypothetical protein
MSNNIFRWHAVFTVVDIVCAILALRMSIDALRLGLCVPYAMLFAFFMWRTWYHGSRAWALR